MPRQLVGVDDLEAFVSRLNSIPQDHRLEQLDTLVVLLQVAADYEAAFPRLYERHKGSAHIQTVGVGELPVIIVIGDNRQAQPILHLYYGPGVRNFTFRGSREAQELFDHNEHGHIVLAPTNNIPQFKLVYWRVPRVGKQQEFDLTVYNKVEAE